MKRRRGRDFAVTQIYYVEDDPDIALAVKAYLERRHFTVTLCATLKEARRRLEARVPSCVLLDWNMPDGRGDGLCRWIRERWEALPVLFLTVRGDSADVVSGFESGADDYVVKPFALDVLHSRILAVLRRAGDAAQRYLSCGGITMDTERRAVFRGREEIPLSAAEYRLLLLLMQNKGRTLPRARLLERVWDAHGDFVNDNTLTVTVKRLREKLPQSACIRTVRSVGYRMEEI